MYKVYYYRADSPVGLETWLEDRAKEGLVLVAASVEYFIFCKEAEIAQLWRVAKAARAGDKVDMRAGFWMQDLRNALAALDAAQGQETSGGGPVRRGKYAGIDTRTSQ